VRFGDGVGGFGVEVVLGSLIGISPQFVRVADVDGDGRPDIILLDSSDFVTVYFGIGGGAVGAPSTLPSFPKGALIFAPAVAKGLAIGDFDGDGRVDIACTFFAQSPLQVPLTGANVIHARSPRPLKRELEAEHHGRGDSTAGLSWSPQVTTSAVQPGNVV